MSPEGEVGSQYEEPSSWKVSRQRPMFGRSTSETMDHAADH